MKGRGHPRLFAAVLLATIALVPAVEAQDAPRTLTLGTGSPGGPYYAYGEGLARILTRVLNIETIAQVTQGPAQNIVLLEKKEAMLGFITTGAGLQGWNGTDWAKGTLYRSMRVIFPMYDTAFQFATLKDSGVRTLDQLTDKRIGAGPRAGTAGTYLPEIFKALGLQASIRHGSWDDMKAQAQAKDLDAVCFVGGVPFPALTSLASSLPVEFIEPSAQQLAIIKQQLPEITPSVVKKGTYQSLERDYATFGLYNFAIAHRDLSDDLVYRIVKAVFDNNQEMIRAQPSARETIPANIERNTLLQMHPGALRYYREAGIAAATGTGR